MGRSAWGGHRNDRNTKRQELIVVIVRVARMVRIVSNSGTHCNIGSFRSKFRAIFFAIVRIESRIRRFRIASEVPLLRVLIHSNF